jgi:hypothetical protein
MTPYSMGVDTTVLMDHTASTNENDVDNDDDDNNNNNNNSLNRGSVVREILVPVTTCLRVIADLTFSITLKSAFNV